MMDMKLIKIIMDKADLWFKYKGKALVLLPGRVGLGEWAFKFWGWYLGLQFQLKYKISLLFISFYLF